MHQSMSEGKENDIAHANRYGAVFRIHCRIHLFQVRNLVITRFFTHYFCFCFFTTREDKNMDSGDSNVVPEWLNTVWSEAPAECLHILMRTGGGSGTVALTHIENLNSESQCVLLTSLQECSGDNFYFLREALSLLWSAQSSDDSDTDMRSANPHPRADAEQTSDTRASNARQINDYDLHFGPAGPGWKSMPAAQRAIFNARTSSASNVKYNEDASIMTIQKSSATNPVNQPGRRAMPKPHTKSRNNKGKRPSVSSLSPREQRLYDRGRRSSQRTASGLSCCVLT